MDSASRVPEVMRVRTALVLVLVSAMVGAGITMLATRPVVQQQGTAPKPSVSSLQTPEAVKAAIEAAIIERDDLVNEKDVEIERLVERYNELTQRSWTDTAQPPADDPSLPRQDAMGRTPTEAVLTLIDAGNRSDWKAMYSLYATPDVDFETMRREYAEASQQYRDFEVLEERVTERDAAFVRVAYTATTSGPDGEADLVRVVTPGEWWPVHRVDGLWKTQWLPRQ